MIVLVLDGNENQSVAAVRSLARAGHRVLVGADTSWSKAGWSRHAAGTFVYPSPEHDADAFVRRIADITRTCGEAFVMPMTERTLLPLSRERDRLVEAGGVFVLPEHERVLVACSKARTTDLAAALGIAVPRTWALDDDPAAAERLAATVPYPVVLKPGMSHEPHDGAMRSTGAPAYATDAASFIAARTDLAARARTIVVQEFVAGRGIGYFALMRHGEPVAEFAHRRIRDVRPTGSGSAVRESVPLGREIRDPSRRLLAALGWHGVAMVEYRLQPDGTLVFLEINGRFWNSLALAIASGVDFPRYLVELGSSGRVSAQPSYRTGVRCRWWLGDVRHLLAVLRGAPAGYPARFPSRLATLAAFFTPVPGTVHDNFWWTDPLPEVGDWMHAGRRLYRSWFRVPGSRFLFRVPFGVHGSRFELQDSSERRTANAEPRTRNHEPRTRNHESRTRNHEPRTRNHESRTRNHEPRTRNHEPRTANRTPNKNLEPGTRNQEQQPVRSW